jgi:hypothetical protein
MVNLTAPSGRQRLAAVAEEELNSHYSTRSLLLWHPAHEKRQEPRWHSAALTHGRAAAALRERLLHLSRRELRRWLRRLRGRRWLRRAAGLRRAHTTQKRSQSRSEVLRWGRCEAWVLAHPSAAALRHGAACRSPEHTATLNSPELLRALWRLEHGRRGRIARQILLEVVQSVLGLKGNVGLRLLVLTRSVIARADRKPPKRKRATAARPRRAGVRYPVIPSTASRAVLFNSTATHSYPRPRRTLMNPSFSGSVWARIS